MKIEWNTSPFIKTLSGTLGLAFGWFYGRNSDPVTLVLGTLYFGYMLAAAIFWIGELWVRWRMRSLPKELGEPVASPYAGGRQSRVLCDGRETVRY